MIGSSMEVLLQDFKYNTFQKTFEKIFCLYCCEMFLDPLATVLVEFFNNISTNILASFSA